MCVNLAVENGGLTLCYEKDWSLRNADVFLPRTSKHDHNSPVFTWNILDTLLNALETVINCHKSIILTYFDLSSPRFITFHKFYTRFCHVFLAPPRPRRRKVPELCPAFPEQGGSQPAAFWGMPGVEDVLIPVHVVVISTWRKMVGKPGKWWEDHGNLNVLEMG